MAQRSRKVRFDRQDGWVMVVSPNSNNWRDGDWVYFSDTVGVSASQNDENPVACLPHLREKDPETYMSLI